ncbi:MAG: phosphate ABC transporter substrate-binding protein [Ktedonobacteraceae bacterium]|nr:phosphate ABC transporter substrate-binding protein [Ktedonobacteraceae bacterium]
MFRNKATMLACAVLVLLLSACTGTVETAELSGHIKVVGSTALQPLVTRAAQLFQQRYPHVQISVAGGGSIYGLQAAANHQSDIGDSDIYADPAFYPDPNLTDYIVCIVPFTMVVNTDVTITNLTSQQLIDIFSRGAIGNWRQLGGPDLTIVPVVRPATSGTRATFRKYILGGRDEKGRLLQTDSSTTVLETVAHTPGAIGYVALSVLHSNKQSSVQAIATDNQTATPRSIASGHYAFWGYEHMYTLGEGNSLVTAFLNFMFTPTVQQEAQKMSYISVDTLRLSTTKPLASG